MDEKWICPSCETFNFGGACTVCFEPKPEVIFAEAPEERMPTVVGTSPVGTSPVGTSPVGTPPVGTPPVGTPPVGTPPVGTPVYTEPLWEAEGAVYENPWGHVYDEIVAETEAMAQAEAKARRFKWLAAAMCLAVAIFAAVPQYNTVKGQDISVLSYIFTQGADATLVWLIDIAMLISNLAAFIFCCLPLSEKALKRASGYSIAGLAASLVFALLELIEGRAFSPVSALVIAMPLFALAAYILSVKAKRAYIDGAGALSSFDAGDTFCGDDSAYRGAGYGGYTRAESPYPGYKETPPETVSGGGVDEASRIKSTMRSSR